MKQNKYFKASLIPENEDELLNNTFGLYIVTIVSLSFIALFQEVLNIISVSSLVGIAVCIYRVAYQLGINKKI